MFSQQIVSLFSFESILEKMFSANSEKCLWTEWFDHDTPCNSDGDNEVHSEHYQRLSETVSGPMRICKPGEMVGRTQYEGGSEITQVSAYEAVEGNAIGFDKVSFKQVLEVSFIFALFYSKEKKNQNLVSDIKL